MQQPEVAIVILNWNGRKWLEKFLPSVFATNYSNYKVIVGDNASTDDSIAFLEAQYPQVEILVKNNNAKVIGIGNLVRSYIKNNTEDKDYNTVLSLYNDGKPAPDEFVFRLIKEYLEDNLITLNKKLDKMNIFIDKSKYPSEIQELSKIIESFFCNLDKHIMDRLF